MDIGRDSYILCVYMILPYELKTSIISHLRLAYAYTASINMRTLAQDFNYDDNDNWNAMIRIAMKQREDGGGHHSPVIIPILSVMAFSFFHIVCIHFSRGFPINASGKQLIIEANWMKMRCGWKERERGGVEIKFSSIEY